MKSYPVCLCLQGEPCLVVGGGGVGERKALDLLAAGARVTVVSPEFTPGLAELAARGRLTCVPGPFAPEHLEGMALVIAAAGDPDANRAVAAAARQRRLPVNIVDAPELGTFIVPATVRRGHLTIAVSTGGASPALARQVRRQLEDWFGPEYEPYLSLLARLRELILSRRRHYPDNRALFTALVDSPLREALAQGDLPRVRAVIQDILGGIISPAVLDDIFVNLNI